MMALLSVAGLCRSFGGIRAVDNIDFQINAGTIMGIIGPNGAGKTSLFNVLTGFLKADAGSVRVDGQEVLGRSPHQLVTLGMARSFQLVKPFFGMRVRETLELPLWAPRQRKQGRNATEISMEVTQLATRIGLQDRLDILVDQLTQGELRMLDIGRALATQPRILFLDEPFSGLSQEEVGILSELITSIKASGMAIVIIEHRLRELMALAERVMVINFGTKLAEGYPNEIVRNAQVIEAYLGIKGGQLATSTR
ncbi:MAG: ABC transporter ATP-binding protein [Castellaniella sp.]